MSQDKGIPEMPPLSSKKSNKTKSNSKSIHNSIEPEHIDKSSRKSGLLDLLDDPKPPSIIRPSSQQYSKNTKSKDKHEDFTQDNR